MTALGGQVAALDRAGWAGLPFPVADLLLGLARLAPDSTGTVVFTHAELARRMASCVNTVANRIRAAIAAGVPIVYTPGTVTGRPGRLRYHPSRLVLDLTGLARLAADGVKARARLILEAKAKRDKRCAELRAPYLFGRRRRPGDRVKGLVSKAPTVGIHPPPGGEAAADTGPPGPITAQVHPPPPVYLDARAALPRRRRPLRGR